MLPTPFARCVFCLCACVCIETGPTSRHRHSQLSLSLSLSLLLSPSGVSHQQVDQLDQARANPNELFRLQFRYWLWFWFCFCLCFFLFLCLYLCLCFWFLCGFAAFAGGIQKRISHVNKISRIINYPTVRTACTLCLPAPVPLCSRSRSSCRFGGRELKNAASVQRHESSNKREAAAGERERGGGEEGGRGADHCSAVQSRIEPIRTETLLWPVNDTKIVCH